MILNDLERDFLDSMRKREAERTAVLRLLKSGLKNFAIAKRVPESTLSDEQVVGVIRQEARKRKESIDAFRKGGRDELALKEEREFAILESYLPPAMDAGEIQKLIDEVIAEQKLEPPFQFGRIMGLMVKRIGGRAEGSVVKEAVERYIETKT